MTKVLDCTLRDGSYVNHFGFSAFDTKTLARALEDAGISYIDVGHGLGLGASRKGGDLSAAASDIEYLEAASEALISSTFGMFCIPGITDLQDVDLAASFGMGFIRIGTDVTKVDSSKPFIERAKNLGMFVCTNFMKSYSVTPEQFTNQAMRSREFGSDVVYIVDSAGGMFPIDLIRYIDPLKDNSDIPFGFHGHNNLGLAVSNSLTAAQNGAHHR